MFYVISSLCASGMGFGGALRVVSAAACHKVGLRFEP
jgi:hypothetical protein